MNNNFTRVSPGVYRNQQGALQQSQGMPQRPMNRPTPGRMQPQAPMQQQMQPQAQPQTPPGYQPMQQPPQMYQGPRMPQFTRGMGGPGQEYNMQPMLYTGGQGMMGASQMGKPMWQKPENVQGLLSQAPALNYNKF